MKTITPACSSGSPATGPSRAGIRASVILFAALSAAFPSAAEVNFRLEIVPDHADAHYHCGDVSELTVTATDTNGVKLTSGTVQVKTDNYGGRGLAEPRTIDLAVANPFKVTASRSMPGFVRWSFSAEGFWKVFGVGYDTAWIVPGTPEPMDFDEFWSDAVAKYDRELPGAPVVEYDASVSDAAWDIWRITLRAPGGRDVHGYVTKPKNAAGRLPGRVEIAAAGYGSWSQAPSRVAGMVSLKMTVYPFRPDASSARQCDYDAMNAAAKAKWGVESYSLGGISGSREECFFYPVILANRRAIDWFAKRDDVDAGNITYCGTSQGGGLGLAAMALSKCFSRGAVFVPALTDVTSYNIEGRQSGWPRMVEGQPEAGKAAASVNAPYFCGANFARRITIPIRFTVGFADDTCAPHAVYSAFNVCPSADKTIVDGIGMTHSVRWELYDSGMKWLNGRE